MRQVAASPYCLEIVTPQLPMEATTMKKLIAAMIGVMFLAGCNTMSGLGQDTQAAGKKLENSADNHKNYRP